MILKNIEETIKYINSGGQIPESDIRSFCATITEKEAAALVGNLYQMLNKTESEKRDSVIRLGQRIIYHAWKENLRK